MASIWSIFPASPTTMSPSKDMIDHIVKLVEAKAAEIDAGSSVSMDVTHGKAA